MKYRKGYKYQLAENFGIPVSWHLSPPNGNIETEFIRLRKEGGVTYLQIRAAYAWDGPSGPTFDTPTAMTASLIHDALYQLIREKFIPNEDGIARHAADAEFHHYCIKAGMGRVRRWYMYWALRRYAAFAADPTNVKEIIEVP